MLYHLLSGFNPGDSPFNLEPLEVWAPHTSAATSKIVARAIQHEPSDRFSTPEEMVKHLKKARVSLEKRGGRPDRSGTQALSEPLSAGAILAAALTLIFVGAGCFAVYELILRGTGG